VASSHTWPLGGSTPPTRPTTRFADLLSAADGAIVADAGLGGPVSYTPDGGDAVTVNGIFDEAYQRLDVGGPGISSVGPAVFLRLEDLPSDPRVDRAAALVIEGVTYVFHEVQPDGQGGVLLHLHKV
jgi:hypothetical protein